MKKKKKKKKERTYTHSHKQWRRFKMQNVQFDEEDVFWLRTFSNGPEHSPHTRSLARSFARKHTRTHITNESTLKTFERHERMTKAYSE